MSNQKYFGEIEFLEAIASIRAQLEEAPSFDEALPCSADASYTNEDSVAVTAVLRIKKWNNKSQPEACYLVGFDVKLARHGFEDILKTGTKEKIIEWLEQYGNCDDATKLLFKIYRSAWETEDSMRFRDW